MKQPFRIKLLLAVYTLIPILVALLMDDIVRLAIFCPIAIVPTTILHWIHVAMWAYIKENVLDMEKFAHIVNAMRYILMYLTGTVIFFIVLTSMGFISRITTLTLIYYDLMCVGPQIAFKVKESCYPRRAPWIITAAVGITISTLLAVSLYFVYA